MLIHGITVTLYQKHKTGVDGFGVPIYDYEPIEVENVLISPAAINAAPEELNIDGKIAEYMLAIPKGDVNEWEDTTVVFFGERWQTLGHVEQGIEDLVPTAWHKKIKVARYE